MHQHDGLSGRHASINFVGHATTLVEMSGARILTDPVFRQKFRFLRRRGELSTGSIDLHKLDAVLLSHMHFDHMDYPSLRMIPRYTPIIAPEGASRYLARKVGHDIVEMRVGDVVRIGDVDIHAMPSQHESGFYWPMWHPRTVLSYMLQGTQTIFFVGDTALFDHMHEIGADFDIDAAMLPVWGFGPYLRGDHMTPAEAAEALSRLNPRVAVPIHWGTYHPVGPWWQKMAFLHRPPHAFAHEASRLAPDTEVRILHPGHRTIVGRPAERPAEVSAVPLVAQPALT
jgi:L-ascorbate metabolism protein UlaG (beta-lactamase superfamily)